MRSFACPHCGQLVFFENTLCLRCHTELGFDAGELAIVRLADAPGGRCANAEIAACNWLAGPDGGLCRSCALTRTRPHDGDAAGIAGFATAEAAKRRLIYQLLDLGLPVGPPLAFDLLSSAEQPVTTGHADGLITLDLAESDDARRERRRTELGEPYRTMLGHCRHEVGHHFEPILTEPPAVQERCRALFGDEREDYQAALDRHYAEGAPEDWPERHVSAYASMHPFEDWAETFAHYLHICDTLQSAASFGMVVTGPTAVRHDGSLVARPDEDPERLSIHTIIAEWLPLTYALNAVSRSMGLEDLYPFTLAPAVIEKLGFVHERVCAVAAA